MITDELVQAFKRKILVTWNDIELDKKILSLMEDAECTLSYKLGNNEIDFNKSSQERRLFLNYCMYEYNNCINDFDTNYKSEILSLRRKYEVRYYRNKVRNCAKE